MGDEHEVFVVAIPELHHGYVACLTVIPTPVLEFPPIVQLQSSVESPAFVALPNGKPFRGDLQRFFLG